MSAHRALRGAHGGVHGGTSPPRSPRAHRGTRATSGTSNPFAAPWLLIVAVAIAVLVSTAGQAAADAEVYQGDSRPTRNEAPSAKWPEPDSQTEDEVVDQISMLRGLGGAGAGNSGRDLADLAAQRERLSSLREQQLQQESQQQLQQEKQVEDSLQEQLQSVRQKQEQPKPQEKPPPPKETAAERLKQQWQDAARIALAQKQQQEAARAAYAKQQQAEEAALAKQQEAAREAVKQQKQKEAEALAKQQQEAARAALAKQQQDSARAALAKQQQQEDEAEAALVKQQETMMAAIAKQQQEEAAQAVAEDRDLLLDDGKLDLARALSQQPVVPAIDTALMRTYLLAPVSGAERWQRYNELAALNQQQLQPALDDLLVRLLSMVDEDSDRPKQWNTQKQQLQQQLQSQDRQQQMQRKAQQQQETQDRQQQMLLQEQHDQMDPSTARRMQAQHQPQTDFTFSFPQSGQSSRFASSPADPRFWQEDPRLGLLSRTGSASQRSQPQEDQFDEGSSGVRVALVNSARGWPGLSSGLSSEQQGDPLDDVDVEDVMGDLGTLWRPNDDLPAPLEDEEKRTEHEGLHQRQQQEHRVTVPVTPERSRHQPKPTVTRDSKLDDVQNNSVHDYPVVKKQLTFPKDHWFFGMDDVSKLAIFIGCSFALSSLIFGFIIWQYRLHRNAKAAADVEYPAYGVTGPSKDISPTGDRRLAQSAQMYHYQHQKQQILAMESRAAGGRRGSMSEAESEDENEEGDYTVYECPGLAPTQEMEVKNPLFQDDPTPATPAPGMGAEAGHDGDGLHEGGKGGQGTRTTAAPKENTKANGKTAGTRSSSKSDKSDKP